MADTSRLRVAILARAIYPWHGHGGLERHVYDLARHLVSHDIYVTLVTPRDTVQPGTVEEAARRLFEDPRCGRRKVRYFTFPLAGRRGTTVLDRITAYPLFGYRAGRLVERLVAHGEIDVVYAVGASGFGYALARRQGARAPLVFNPQGLEEFGATDPRHGGSRIKRTAYGPLRTVVRICARAADIVIATDRVLQPVVQRHLRVDPARIRVVPNAIDVDACDRFARTVDVEAVRAAHGISDNEAVLLSVGRLEANKGFHVLAHALAGLIAVPGWRWVLVGDGPYRSTIERAIAAHGLRDRVVLAGRVSEGDLHAWYEAAALFVHPTLYEGSSIVTLEAMAHRRAVVATRAGGLPDKVEPGKSGWLVDPGDVRQLQEALGAALADRERLADMGREGRAIVDARFSWPRVLDTLLGVFAELLPART